MSRVVRSHRGIGASSSMPQRGSAAGERLVLDTAIEGYVLSQLDPSDEAAYWRLVDWDATATTPICQVPRRSLFMPTSRATATATCVSWAGSEAKPSAGSISSPGIRRTS